MAISDADLLSIVRRESDDAEEYVTSEISDERQDAMRRYLGEEYGDEKPGRSKIITREVFETIEWAMPSLLKVFASGDNVVEYAPQGPEDEKGAEQATDYANYVFYNDNNGFLILNSWMKDALLAKQGVVKSWWEFKEKREDISYTGLSNDQYMDLVNDPSIEVNAHSGWIFDGMGGRIDLDEDQHDELMAQGQELGHDIDVTHTTEDGRIKTMPVPPEEFFMSRSASDPDDATLLEHRTTKTSSDLIEAGFDKDLVDSLPDADLDDATDERSTRLGNTVEFQSHADNAMREVTIRESYVYVDMDETGIADRWKITWGGEIILDKEKVTSQPFSVIQAIPIPHRAYGLSLADIVMDLQRIKTVIMRQTLDNLYLANNPEREVNVNLIEDMDDFLMSRPGGIKRVKAINASREISHPFVAQHSFPMLDGIDSMISTRTGISDSVTGIDADALSNQTATASNNNLAQANQRIETIARIFAETGYKHLFKTYLRLMAEHQDKARVIRLRGEWVEVDPRSWNAEMDVSIDVGLGHGNKDQQVSHLMNLLGWQKEMLASGGVKTAEGKIMIRPKHIYNTFEKVVKAVGFKSIDMFMDDPGDAPLPEQQPPADPNEALIKGQMQIEQLKAQSKMSEAQMKAHYVEQESQRKHELAVAGLALDQEKLTIEREKIAAGMQETAAKIDADKDKAAAQLYNDSQKALHDAEQKSLDREVSAIEKNKDRHASVYAASQKNQKRVTMSRNENGDMVGEVEE